MLSIKSNFSNRISLSLEMPGIDFWYYRNNNKAIFWYSDELKGVKKLKEDERKSIRILEQSFFVNEKAAIDDEIKMDPDGNHMGSHFCEECEISFNITSHFARYCLLLNMNSL